MVGKITKRVVALAIIAAVAACNGSNGAHDAGPPDAGQDAGSDAGEPAFEVGLREAAHTSPLYSISFDEQGPFLLTLFYVASSPLICDPLQTPATPQWILELWTPLASGTYAVGPSNSDQYPPLSGQAVVVLRGSDPGSFHTIEVLPTEGQVVIGTAPLDATAELSGSHLGGSFHIGFPEKPIYPSDCYGGGEVGPDGGLIDSEAWCLCQDPTGSTVSVCDGGTQDECCLSTQPATIFIDGTFDAPPCYLLCIAPVATGGCAQLEPDGGAPGECPAECSGPIWPNVLIGIEDADGGDASAAVTEVDVQSFDGGPLQPAYPGTPEASPAGLLVSYWTFSGLAETPIAVHLLDGGEIDGTVSVGPNEECGANEGYALFSLAGTPHLVNKQTIQLCQ